MFPLPRRRSGFCWQKEMQMPSHTGQNGWGVNGWQSTLIIRGRDLVLVDVISSNVFQSLMLSNCRRRQRGLFVLAGRSCASRKTGTCSPELCGCTNQLKVTVLIKPTCLNDQCWRCKTGEHKTHRTAVVWTFLNLFIALLSYILIRSAHFCRTCCDAFVFFRSRSPPHSQICAAQRAFGTSQTSISFPKEVLFVSTQKWISIINLTSRRNRISLVV